MLNLKNLKVVKELKNIQPKLKWMMFSEMEDYKINSEYFDLLCGDKDSNVEATELYLERMVCAISSSKAPIKYLCGFMILTCKPL